MTDKLLIAHLFTQEAAHLKLVREMRDSLPAASSWWDTRREELDNYLKWAQGSLRERVNQWLHTSVGFYIEQNNVALVSAGYYKCPPETED